jgi:hypothetical protein
MREFFNKLSGTQITIILLALAVSGPGTLGAAVVYQAVALVDPTTGAKAKIDSAKSLHVADPFVDYAFNPANFVTIAVALPCNKASSTNPMTIYSPPSGKALLIKSSQMHAFDNAFGNTIVVGAATKISNKALIFFTTSNMTDSLSTVYASPLVVKAPDSIATTCATKDTTTLKIPVLQIQGYLVPATTVPATASVEEAEQFVQIGKLPLLGK